MKRFYVFLAALLVATSFAAAQDSSEDVDRAILASTANFPDAFIASAPSDKLGIPVLLTDKNQLTESTRQSLEDMGADEIIIVGGPAVVSDSVQSEVDSVVNSTTRLFGTTQIGTSIEVSSYFWGEGSESATVVQYPQDAENGYKLLSAVKNEVQDEDEPILISKTGTLSASVISEIERLGATEVDVYSTDAVNVTQDLEEIGVTEVEIEEPEQESENETEEIDELSDQVQSRAAETTGNRSTLVIVAAANFRHAISVPATANSASFVVGSEEQVSDAVELVKDTDAERIKVTGKPEFARQIADRIESETNRSVDFVSGPPETVAANITVENRQEWNRIQERQFGRWRQEVENSDGIREQANRTLRKAESAVDSNASEETQEHLIEAQEAFREDEYFEARKEAVRALSMANSERYQRMRPEEVREAVQDDREDLQEAIEEMQELNSEMAQELREAETQEERLEIIREFRDERHELRKEFREKRRERRDDGRERVEVSNSEVKLELEGHELKTRAEYIAPTLGYTWSKDIARNGDTVSFTFNLQSPDGMAGQQVKRYRTRSELGVENGSYTVNVDLKVDGKSVNSLSRDVSVPGFAEYESEIEQEEEKEDETSETEETDSSGDNTVTYTDSGFEPREITVERGEDVTWINEASTDMWVASDDHPTHTRYDGTSLRQHCEDGESDTFDQCSSGDSYEFEFEKTGVFGYHNHEAAGDTGAVVVE